jgi:hypothetical protein
MPSNYNFSLNVSQIAKFEAWRVEMLKRKDNPGAIGGQFTFKFIPTSIGTIIKVVYSPTLEELDLTDYAEF